MHRPLGHYAGLAVVQQAAALRVNADAESRRGSSAQSLSLALALNVPVPNARWFRSQPTQPRPVIRNREFVSNPPVPAFVRAHQALVFRQQNPQLRLRPPRPLAAPRPRWQQFALHPTM